MASDQLPTDADLVTDYAIRHSEIAFARLVERYAGLVYSSALRQVLDPHLAEEITQAVFIILARKANSLGANVVLAGWLCRTTRFAVCDALKAERRRRLREQFAYQSNVMSADDLSNQSESEANAWHEVAPLLDQAVAQLSDADRNAIVLRYYEQRSLEDVGHALGIGADAAQKRVARALEKLRTIFAKRGVTVMSALIADAVAANAVQPAPATLMAAITAVAAKGSAAGGSTLTLVKGTMKAMTGLKIKFAIGVGLVALVAGGVATVNYATPKLGDHLTAQDIVSQAKNTYAALSSYSDTGTNISTVAGNTITTVSTIKLQQPNLYRIDWTQSLIDRVMIKGVTWSDGTADYWVMGANGQEKNSKPEKSADMRAAMNSATMASGGWMVSTIPELFFNQNWNGILSDLTLTRQRDEKVNGIDCYVLAGRTASAGAKLTGEKSTMIWIGKQDRFIHKTEMAMKAPRMTTTPEVSDEQIKKVLVMQNKPATPEAIAAMRPMLAETLKKTQQLMNSSSVSYSQTRGNISVNENFSPSDFKR